MHDEKRCETQDGFELFYVKDIPQKPRAIITIVHGLGEHCGRYDYVVSKFNQLGYGVYRFDNRGHGHSTGKRGYIADFREYIYDTDLIVEIARKEYPGKPLFMLGHSMGGFIAVCYGIKYPGKLVGQVLSGPVIIERTTLDYLKSTPEDLIERKFIPNSMSALICRDEKVVAAYEADPLVLEKITLRLLKTVYLDGISWLNDHLSQYNSPCLILHGGDDKLVSPEHSQHLYEKISSANKKMEIYESLFHEILNETRKDDIIADIDEWIKKGSVRVSQT